MLQPKQVEIESLPPLTRDPSFWGMTVTQFLGAFNDNLFKQLVLLLCVDLALEDRTQNYQGVATIVFALPFVLFSGFGGFLADRYSKRAIVVLCKALEIVIMLLGVLAFLWGSLPALMAVLFCMAAQSAFFGPPKYGILPEMVRPQDLPRANGIMLMTTFLAIIFGFAVAGYVKEVFSDNLWMASSTCIVLAIVGTLTSLVIRPTPVAQPDLKFDPTALAVSPDTRRLLRDDREMLKVLLVSSAFWFVGGVVYPPAINDLGKLQLELGDTETGRLAAMTGVGIAIGCVLAGRLSRGKVSGKLIRTGAWGLFVCLTLLALPGASRQSTFLGESGAMVALVGVGLFAGFFTVPLQVFLQARAPVAQKGRIIGAMNLINWIGIALSGVFYSIMNLILAHFKIPPSGMFAAAACLMLLLASTYRPKDMELV